MSRITSPLWRVGLVLAGLALLAACSELPRGAAVEGEVLKGAGDPEADFAVYPVDRAFLPKVARWPRTGPGRAHGWISRYKFTEGPVIRAGDKISVAIWDSSENSLLTAPGQRVVPMTDLTVSGSGTVFVPYIQTVEVAGKTSDEARSHIQEQMTAIIPDAQVQLSVTRGRGNAVDLVGGVSNPGNYPIDGESFSVLNLISLGGGVPSSLRNPQVRLVRGKQIYQTALSVLYAQPARDAILIGGDKVIIEEDKRYFMALGAAGAEKIVYFETERMNALEAMSMIGGVSDSTGNPQGILVLRQFPKSAVRKDEVRGPAKDRAIFVIDLTSADGLFSAGQFEIRPGDTVLVTDASVTVAQSLFTLIGRLFTISSNL